MSALRVAVYLVESIAAYGFYRLARYIYSLIFSPMRYFPGPSSKNLLFGNFKEISDTSDTTAVLEKWTAAYGNTIALKGFFYSDRLFTVDTKALNHVLMNDQIYQKPEPTRYFLGRILGEGILITEGQQHKTQRKIMNPAFGPVQIRELTYIFTEKAVQLRDIWASEITAQGGTARVEILSWLSRMTLDVIGLAGFNYDFNALNADGEINELQKAFSTMLDSTTDGLEILAILKSFFPIFRIIPGRLAAEIAQAQRTTSRIGYELLRNSKAAVLASREKDGSEKRKGGRDLLSLLVRANMAEDLPEDQRLSDKDVIAQVPTFLVAGHETTSSAVTWALFALTQDLAIQTKLRNELMEVATDEPTMDQLNALPYLDKVVRETLRVHAPVPSTIRIATRDDVLPLNEPFVDRKGVKHDVIPVSKGQQIILPILALNRSKAIWGDDAFEFRPERWESVPEAASTVPGLWSNLMTFIGGPRSCIGYRFSLVEMKALLFTLVRAFEFELAVPVADVSKKTAIVQRPFLLSDTKAGNQLPLRIRPYQRV